MKDAHTEHCCITHGCKYSDPRCTVTTGGGPQSFDCEECIYDRDERINMLHRMWSDACLDLNDKEIKAVKRLLKRLEKEKR